MKNDRENTRFDISRRSGSEFRHYQLIVKLMRVGMTEHHHLEIFTGAPHQLLEMRRLYAAIIEKIDYRTLQRYSKNN